MDFIYISVIIKIRLILFTRLILTPFRIMRLINNIYNIDEVYYIIIIFNNII